MTPTQAMLLAALVCAIFWYGAAVLFAHMINAVLTILGVPT